MQKGNLIINDPVYGFTVIPRGLLCKVIDHPLFQRLDRIRQLGMSGIVYPGATHTRKQHSIGAFHLMQEAIRSLTEKGIFIFDAEAEAVGIAILLHDIGHGPYSHVLEQTLVNNLSHEEISLMMMEKMNEDFNGELGLAIKIYRDEYPKHFFHELICSQLDMDRLDYLCRDSFYTGVREGNIGAARIIKMLDVADDRLVVRSKGIYSVENYLMSRRLMYWQVYLHKTAVAAEELLRATLERAKELAAEGVELPCSPALRHFLYGNISAQDFRNAPTHLQRYSELDDCDILSALKAWQTAPDSILSTLAKGFINRHLFKARIYDDNIPDGLITELQERISAELNLPMDKTHYFVRTKTVEKEMYSATSEGIGILFPDGEIRDVATASHIVRTDRPETGDRKHYVFTLGTMLPEKDRSSVTP